MSARCVPRHRCPKNWSSLPTATVLGLRLSRTRPFGAYHSVCKAVEGIGTLPDNGPLRSGCAAATAAVSAFPSGIALKVAAAAAPVTAASPLAHRSPMGAFSVAFAIKIGREVARFLRLIAAGRDLTITSKNTKKLLKKTNF